MVFYSYIAWYDMIVVRACVRGARVVVVQGGVTLNFFSISIPY